MPTKKRALRPGLHVNMGENKPPPVPVIPPGIDSTATITIGNDTFVCNADDLLDEGELGRGAYGSVYQMRHLQTNTVMAVKRIRATVDSVERRRLLMDLSINMRSLDCPYTVTYYGALFREGDVWICMELMDKSLHQLYKLVYEKLKLTIPEKVIGKMAEATIKALHFLKFTLNVLHRDVKPSNILINKAGEVKLCDFGIAGELVNSFCQTDIGCKPYLAPERINPEEAGAKYDQRSDVWSYGITVYELALGQFPYPTWKNVFEQLRYVVEGEPPKVPADAEFSSEFKEFIHLCLTKKVQERPKYDVLVEHPFIKMTEQLDVDVGAWYRDILDREAALT